MYRFRQRLVDAVKNARDRTDLYHAPRNAFLNLNSTSSDSNVGNDNLKIIVVAAPCHGLGDVIFALKCARYLRYGFGGDGDNNKPYSRDVTIVTPSPELFRKVGLALNGRAPIKLVRLGQKNSTRASCRRLQKYERPRALPRTVDLIFVAPHQIDFDVDYADVRALFHESNPFNTVFVSEYNDSLTKGHDLATGLGGGRLGLLFDGARPAPVSQTPLPRAMLGAGKRYALAYASQDVGYKGCARAFAELVMKRYSGTTGSGTNATGSGTNGSGSGMQLVVPRWIAEKLSRSRAFLQSARTYGYTDVYTVFNDDANAEPTHHVTDDDDGRCHQVFVIRGDILPVTRPQMLTLMRHSVSDILVTGDQSLTDIVDCCAADKRIWYQTAPWKSGFAKALATILKRPALANATTSCGSVKLRSIDTNRHSAQKLKRDCDFRVLAKPVIDAIVASVCAYTFYSGDDSDDDTINSIVRQYIDTLLDAGAHVPFAALRQRALRDLN